jgi:isovaleryl-CoA dehydrogenase
LVFEDCRVPAENLVGAENEGVAVVMSGLDLERAAVAATCVGMAERALDLALDYATTRVQFGKPLAEFQMIQSLLAEIYVDLESARAFAYRAVAACEGLEKGAGGRGEIHKLTAAAVLYAAEAFNRVVTKANHIFGGAGYMRDMEINRLYRAIKLMEIGAGTSEVRKIIVSSELLKQ